MLRAGGFVPLQQLKTILRGQKAAAALRVRGSLLLGVSRDERLRRDEDLIAIIAALEARELL